MWLPQHPGALDLSVATTSKQAFSSCTAPWECCLSSVCVREAPWCDWTRRRHRDFELPEVLSQTSLQT